MIPLPKATSCTTLSARRRLRLATPKRQATPTLPRSRPARYTRNSPASVNTTTKAARPALNQRNSFASRTTAEHEQQHHGDRRSEGEQHQGRRWPDVAAQHPQRRHACELQQRGQRKAGQHGDGGDEADRERRETRRRQVGHREQPAYRAQQPLLGEVAEG